MSTSVFMSNLIKTQLMLIIFGVRNSEEIWHMFLQENCLHTVGM